MEGKVDLGQYFSAVETNERGVFHMHGLLWLHGNGTEIHGANCCLPEMAIADETRTTCSQC